MIKTTAIKLIKPEPMMVTWDTGRRCNYDCTYCESTRHDLHSPHKSYEEFVSTFEFVKRWTKLYNSKKIEQTHTNINFTGGEPTINPNFWKLVDYIKQDSDDFQLSLTTNGAWDIKNTEKIVKNFHGVTVSYHAEAVPQLRKRVIRNIKSLHSTGIWLQVNVMLHMDYWKHTVEVFEELRSLGIKANPRPIGDGGVERTGWFVDADGTNRRTSHPYTPEQQAWFFDTMGLKGTAEQIRQGTQLGRACCGGRCLQGKVDGDWQEVKLVNTEFKDWSCMVDWYFLHIDQHTGDVYHHQTCQALPGKQRGAIGNLKYSEQLLTDLEARLANPKPIVCPNLRCGCGMCIPKAKDTETFNQLWSSIVSS